MMLIIVFIVSVIIFMSGITCIENKLDKTSAILEKILNEIKIEEDTGFVTYKMADGEEHRLHINKE